MVAVGRMNPKRSSLESLARSARLGRVAYHAWHRPVAWIRDFLRDGGPLVQRRTELGRREMELAAAGLPRLPTHPGAPVSLHLLTGRRFWYQTVFCLWSFSRQSGRNVAPIIYDDGTLDESVRAPISRIFPQARFIEQPDAIARLDVYLPVTRFPALRDRWTNYPHIRKLIDPHLGSRGWKLVVDSDLLFFHPPKFLLDWNDHPDRPLHAVDCVTSYGYTRQLMNELAGREVADLVNVGVAGLRSEDLDWDRVERWCDELIRREGTNYYLEQAIVAMLVAGSECAVAPASDYVTLPRPPEVETCKAAMHHYVAESKRWYFQTNWRRILQNQ
jgi:hypothetical protein